MSDHSENGIGQENQPDNTIARVYDRCAEKLFRYALMILADASSAEDVLHQVFFKLLKVDHKIESYDKYLRTAVRNECYRVLEKKRKCHDRLLAVSEILAHNDAGNEEERQIVEKAICTLPPDQREVVYLKIYEDMTFQQIADALEISLNTAASRYRYAMDKLKIQLKDLKQ